VTTILRCAGACAVWLLAAAGCTSSERAACVAGYQCGEGFDCIEGECVRGGAQEDASDSTRADETKHDSEETDAALADASALPAIDARAVDGARAPDAPAIGRDAPVVDAPVVEAPVAADDAAAAVFPDGSGCVRRDGPGIAPSGCDQTYECGGADDRISCVFTTGLPLALRCSCYVGGALVRTCTTPFFTDGGFQNACSLPGCCGG
jgi:hypothetical protein